MIAGRLLSAMRLPPPSKTCQEWLKGIPFGGSLVLARSAMMVSLTGRDMAAKGGALGGGD